MLLILICLLIGICIGAALVEILRKRRPEVIAAIERQARVMTDKLMEARSGEHGRPRENRQSGVRRE